MGDTVWATDLAPIIEVSRVDPVTGNLLVNGQPFFMVRGDDVDYQTELVYSGYTISQWDVHLRAARDAGMNVISANWGTIVGVSPSLFDDPTYDNTKNVDINHWNRFGQYVWGDAGGDATPPPGGLLHIVPVDVPWFQGVMNPKKNQSNLLLWQVSGELQVNASPSVWNPVYAVMQSIDPTRTRGDYILTNNVNLQSWFDLASLAVPIPEVVLHPPWPFMPSNETSGSQVGPIYDVLNTMDAAWNAGHRFVYGLSITPIAELDHGQSPATLSTTSSTTVTGGASPGVSNTVTPAAMSGTFRNLTWAITVGTGLQIDVGGVQENVTVTAVTATTFTALFVNNHSGTWNIQRWYPGGVTFPPRNQIRRCHWYMIARNCRQLTMLWGPGQRGIPYDRNGDTGLTTGAAGTTLIWDRGAAHNLVAYPSGVNGTITDPELTPMLDNGRLPTPLDVFGYWTEVIADITSLKNVILDPQRWTHLTTTPSDGGFASSGIYAASKTVGSVTYVIACNLLSVNNTFSGEMFAEEAAVGSGGTGATITVGVGTTCVRLFEAGAPTFSGGVITDSFRAMETHVYKVT